MSSLSFLQRSRLAMRVAPSDRGDEAQQRNEPLPAAAIRGPTTQPLGIVGIAYESVDWSLAKDTRLTDALYEEYGLQSIRISGSQAHPTKLVQSAAMVSVQLANV